MRGFDGETCGKEPGVGVDGKVTLKWIFKQWNGKAWIGFICLWIETVGGRLRMRQ